MFFRRLLIVLSKMSNWGMASLNIDTELPKFNLRLTIASAKTVSVTNNIFVFRIFC